MYAEPRVFWTGLHERRDHKTGYKLYINLSQKKAIYKQQCLRKKLYIKEPGPPIDLYDAFCVKLAAVLHGGSTWQAF